MNFISHPRRSTENRKPNSTPTPTTFAPLSITNTFQIGDLISHHGRRNLTVKDFPGSKRSVPTEWNGNVWKKLKKAQDQTCLSTSTPMESISRNQKVTPTPTTPRTPRRIHVPVDPKPAKRVPQRQPECPFIRIPISSLLQPEPPLQSTPKPLAFPRLVEPPVKLAPKASVALQPRYELIPAENQPYGASKKLPTLPGLDLTTVVDFSRKYSAEHNRRHTNAHPMHIKAAFQTQSSQPSPSSRNRLPGSVSVLEPSKFYSPVKKRYEVEFPIAPLRLRNGVIHHRLPWVPPEAQWELGGFETPKLPKRTVGGDPKTSFGSSFPSLSQSSSPVNTTTPPTSSRISSPTSYPPHLFNKPTPKSSNRLSTPARMSRSQQISRALAQGLSPSIQIVVRPSSSPVSPCPVSLRGGNQQEVPIRRRSVRGKEIQA